MVQYFSRWYDKDPVLSMSMKTLENTDDSTQIRVALNLIKVIIEHNISAHKFEDVEDIIKAVSKGFEKRGNARWYDIEKTVRTAIQMLEDCSETTKQKIALEMAKMVVSKIKEEEAPLYEDEDEEVTVLDLDNEEF